MIGISILRSGARRLGAMWARRVEAARIGRELGDSSDRALAELGLARGDVQAVAQGGFGRT